jgi:hypothetical protein
VQRGRLAFPPRPSDVAWWGAFRFFSREDLRGPNFHFRRQTQLLRRSCDASGFKLLPIEIIAKRKAAPAFEPQKLSWVDGRTS